MSQRPQSPNTTSSIRMTYPPGGKGSVVRSPHITTGIAYLALRWGMLVQTFGTYTKGSVVYPRISSTDEEDPVHGGGRGLLRDGSLFGCTSLARASQVT